MIVYRQFAFLLALVMLHPVALPLLRLWAEPVCQMKCSRLGKDCCCRKKAASHGHGGGAGWRVADACGPSCRMAFGGGATGMAMLALGAQRTAAPLIAARAAACEVGCVVVRHEGLAHRQRPPPLSHS